MKGEHYARCNYYNFNYILYSFNLIVTLEISSQVNDNDTKFGGLIAIKEFIEELFYDRNFFGMLLSAVVLILSVPAILIVIATQTIFWIGMALEYIYNLGNKKNR